MTRELSAALRSAITGTLTACALLASLWLAAGNAPSPAGASTTADDRAACTSWQRTGPISNSNRTAVWVVDRDGFVPPTKIAPGAAVTFHWSYPATVKRHVDVVTVTGNTGRNPLALSVTLTRPASCTP